MDGTKHYKYGELPKDTKLVLPMPAERQQSICQPRLQKNGSIAYLTTLSPWYSISCSLCQEPEHSGFDHIIIITINIIVTIILVFEQSYLLPSGGQVFFLGGNYQLWYYNNIIDIKIIIIVIKIILIKIKIMLIITIMKKSYDQIIPGREVECFETRTCMSCRVPVDAVPVMVMIIMIITIYHDYHDYHQLSS